MSTNGNYSSFLNRKLHDTTADGFEPDDLPEVLFDYQAHLVRWSLQTARSAIFADCGLGKTLMQIVWADKVTKHARGRVLIVAPLAVSTQTVEEANTFGFSVTRSRDGKPAGGITITNYERLHLFNPADYVGVVLDESSILKSFNGKRQTQITDFMRRTPYRLLATATAAPNDYTELGTSSEALGRMGHVDMLNTFFKNDQNNTALKRQYGQAPKWRFRGHAETPFWRWVLTWARAIRKPSDLGYSDTGFNLPPLNTDTVTITEAGAPEGLLFQMPAGDLQQQRDETRRTLPERVAYASHYANTTTEQVVVWCNLNEESAELARLIPDAVEVAGKHTDDQKEDRLTAFRNGQARVLVTKPKIGGWGLNLQSCHRVVYFPTHSYEQYYQAVRRCWRYGQKNPVEVKNVITPGLERVMLNLERKSDQAARMFDNLVTETAAAASLPKAGARHRNESPSMVIDQKIAHDYAVYHADCMEVLTDLQPGLIHLSVYSPPFAGLYNYSSDPRDVSNNTREGFLEHYGMVIKELARVTMPGRMTCVHVTDIPMGNTGTQDGLYDLPGDVIRLHEAHGWAYTARHTIWKEPLWVRNRTMVKALAHQTIVQDAANAGVASADYLLVFRNAGDNPVPVQHPVGFTHYAGEMPVPAELHAYRGWDKAQTENRFSHWVWRQYASSVWDDIRMGNVLPYKEGTDPDDEKHVHPLQLDVIERCVSLRSNPGEVVLTPFMGVGSEAFAALKLGRRAIGVELKASYYRQALRNLGTLSDRPLDAGPLFEHESVT